MAPVTNPETEAAFQRLETETGESETVKASAGALITNLAQMLRDAAANAVDHAELQARVNAMADRLDASQGTLSQLIVDNTPAAGGGGSGPTP